MSIYIFKQGLFVALVQKNSPAALAGLRFGDQILSINGQTVAGWDNDKAHKVIKGLDPQRITFAVRDRSVAKALLSFKESVKFIEPAPLRQLTLGPPFNVLSKRQGDKQWK